MAILLELQCINQDDPSTEDCYSLNEKAVYESADDTQADLIRAFKLVQDMAERNGWKRPSSRKERKGCSAPAASSSTRRRPGTR